LHPEELRFERSDHARREEFALGGDYVHVLQVFGDDAGVLHGVLLDAVVEAGELAELRRVGGVLRRLGDDVERPVGVAAGLRCLDPLVVAFNIINIG